MRISKSLAATTAVFAALTGANAAFAQQSGPAPAPADQSDGIGLDVIVVTAQKREENLQDTPIAVSVITGGGLEDRQVYSLTDLGDGAIPSLKVAPFFSRPGALIMNIRGIGVLSDSNQPARDQGVGIYVDGVYLGRPQGLGTALYDVDQIEVLKGPQGTLFGRNTEGGAVSITTKRPTGEFGLTAKAGVANFEGYSSEFHLNLPKFNGLSFKISGVANGRGGWVSNPLPTAEDFGAVDKRALRARLLWEPTDNFTVDYAYDTAVDSTTTLYQQFVAASPYAIALQPAAGNKIQADRADTATFGVPQARSVGVVWGHRLTAEWVINDNLTLKSISSYRDLKQGQWDNGSAAQSNGAFRTGTTFLNQQFSRYSLADFHQDQWSQEIQLIGDTERLKWVVGALYYVENADDNARAFSTNVFTDAVGVNNVPLGFNPLNARIDRASEVETTSQGVFGQATYTPPILNDQLHVTLGGRWTEDAKDGRLKTVNGVNFPVGRTGVFGGLTIPAPLDTSWSRFDPVVNVAYDLNDDIMVYARYSTGYRSGGGQSRSLLYTPFNPETVEVGEIGSKMELFDRRLRLNLAAYLGNYEDIQLDFFAQYLQTDPVTGALLQTQRTTTETTNAPGVGTLRGFEADFQFAATENLTFSGGYAYNFVKIPATRNPFPQANGVIIRQPIPIYQVYTPENSWNIAADYERPWGEAKFVAHLDANFGEGYYVSATDVAYDANRAVRIKNPKGDDSFIVNGRISLAEIPAGPGTASVSLWSRNLLNDEHKFAVFLSERQGTGAFFNEPRTFGIEFGVKM